MEDAAFATLKSLDLAEFQRVHVINDVVILSLDGLECALFMGDFIGPRRGMGDWG